MGWLEDKDSPGAVGVGEVKEAPKKKAAPKRAVKKKASK